MEMSNISRDKQEIIMREVLQYLSTADYSKCNPEVIGGTWDIITKNINDKDPYKNIKEYYNLEVLKMTDMIEEIIKSSDNHFNTALKIAIAGNLIDFNARHKFDFNLLKEKIENIIHTDLAIDDGEQLYEQLGKAKTILYLGDNCGEICLDKIFIKYIKEEFPDIDISYAVRGNPIVNDVTSIDAKMVDMHSVANVIENGDSSLGTVIDRTSKEFKDAFYSADVIISKGQGNYEGLTEIDRGVFHLFMPKCKPIADLVSVKPMSIVCVEYKKS